MEKPFSIIIISTTFRWKKIWLLNFFFQKKEKGALF